MKRADREIYNCFEDFLEEEKKRLLTCLGQFDSTCLKKFLTTSHNRICGRCKLNSRFDGREKEAE